MFTALSYGFMQKALIASILGGAVCGLVGVWIVMLGIPFIGVAMSHAAFAGALFGLFAGIDPVLSALFFCLAAAVFIGPLAERSDLDPNMSIGIIFSFVLGLAFFFMGLIKGPKTEALKFIWGNILTVDYTGILLLAATLAAVLIFILLIYKEILAVLFSRETARASGINEKAILYSMLFLCGVTVTLNLNTVGGVLIFSLIITPAAAAYQFTYSLKKMYLLSAVFGVSACLLGLLFSYLFNVPSGAVIIIASTAIFGISMALSSKRRVNRDGIY